MTHANKQDANIVGVAFVAAMAGALAGLLFAPKRGADTRYDIKQKYVGMKRRSSDAAQATKESIDRGAQTVKSKTQAATDKVSETAHDINEAAKETRDELEAQHRADRSSSDKDS